MFHGHQSWTREPVPKSHGSIERLPFKQRAGRPPRSTTCVSVMANNVTHIFLCVDMRTKSRYHCIDAFLVIPTNGFFQEELLSWGLKIGRINAILIPKVTN